jgi:hypothetical protein
MGQLVSSSVMADTWKRVALSTGTDIQRLQKQCGKDQNELTGFVLGFTSDLRPQALGIVLYAHAVIMEAFRCSGIRVRKIKVAVIMRTWKETVAAIATLKDRGEHPPQLRAQPGLGAELAVLQYAIDALVEETDDNIVLTPEEFWRCLSVLVTVISCMHNAGSGGKNAV